LSCAASADGCLDLRRRAIPAGGQVGTEWSRWHGMLETVWLLCDEAQQVGCSRG